MPLTTHHFKPPNLVRRPATADALRQSLHMLPLHIVIPSLQKVVVVHIRQLDPPTPALDLAEYPVLVLPPRVVERAVFRRAAHAAGGDLGDVDVGALVGCAVDVLAYVQGDGGVGDGFAQEPGYALLVGLLDGHGIAVKGCRRSAYDLQDSVVVIGEGFVLRGCQDLGGPGGGGWSWRSKPWSRLR